MKLPKPQDVRRAMEEIKALRNKTYYEPWKTVKPTRRPKSTLLEILGIIEQSEDDDQVAEMT